MIPLRIRFACLVSLACLALPAASAPARAEAAWRAVCGAKQCNASVRTQADRRDAAYGAQLRITRVPGGAHELVLISPHAQPAPGAPIEVRVDGQAIARLAAGTGYRPARSGGTLIIERTAALRLYAPMRAGQRIAFTFAAARGNPVILELSLRGFSAAARTLALPITAAREADVAAPAAARTDAPPATPPAPPPANARDASPALPGQDKPPVLEGPTLPAMEGDEDSMAPAAPAAATPAPPDMQLSQPLARARTGEVVLATLRSRSPDDWTRFLPELRPAIDACLERTPGSDLHVTKAWPMIGGLAGVRTRNATVGWFDCVAAQSGNRVERFGPVSKEIGRAPGEDVVVYTRVDGQPPEGKCYRSERVIDDYKETVGWLSRNLCHPDAAPAGRR